MKIEEAKKKFDDASTNLLDAMRWDIRMLTRPELGDLLISKVVIHKDYEGEHTYKSSVFAGSAHPYDSRIVNAERLIDKYIADNCYNCLCYVLSDGYTFNY